jgi:hypothetical protein
MKNAMMLLPMLLLLGCQTNLVPDGIYDGDVALYRAESTIVSSYELMDNFLLWEYENRASMASMPEVKEAADVIRANGEEWIDTAIALVEAYKLNPTKENQINLNQAVAVIQTALTEAAKYMNQ